CVGKPHVRFHHLRGGGEVHSGSYILSQRWRRYGIHDADQSISVGSLRGELMNKTLMCGLLAGCLLLTAAWADPILTLNPANGVISGLPGTTVGWGFTFTNDTNYAVITGSQFCASTSSPLPDICFPLAPNLGTYADFAGAQFLVAGSSPENSVISQTFDNTA